MNTPEIYWPDEFAVDFEPQSIPDGFVIEDDITMSVVSAEFSALGYAPEAELSIYPRAGRYVVAFKRADGTRGEYAWEPSEPEAKRLSVQWAFHNAAGAVRDALEGDIRRRSEGGQ